MSAELQEQLRLLSMKPDESLRASHFPIRPRLLRLKQRMRGQARALIQARRAADLVLALPRTEDESTHALLSGEFILGDVIDQVRARYGDPRALWISTLSVGMPNIATLEAAGRAGIPVCLLVSHYFQSAEKVLFEALQSALLPIPGFKIVVGRLHTKVLLFDYPDWPLTLTTSANLRSSNNLEQLDAFAAPPLFFFHRDWMMELVNRAEAGMNPSFAVKINAGGAL